jgi:hypothetical protein
MPPITNIILCVLFVMQFLRSCSLRIGVVERERDRDREIELERERSGERR